MKILTEDLIGQPLEWAVATALKLKVAIYNGQVIVEIPSEDASVKMYETCSYSTIGTKTAVVMEDEWINTNITTMCGDYKWLATIVSEHDTNSAHGPTLLIAAMRALVEFKLGEEIDIPNVLLWNATIVPELNLSGVFVVPSKLLPDMEIA
jgi:hypothetical protein